MVIAGLLALLVQATPPTTACGTGSETWPTKKWQVAEPAAVGLDPDSLRALAGRARSIPGVTSLMIVRHGQIALEEYFHGGARGDAEAGGCRRPRSTRASGPRFPCRPPHPAVP